MIKNLKINYIANLLDGGFFGFAIGFASFTAIIPLFVSTMTNSALLIGLIPAIHNMGWQLPQLLTANKISKLPRFKPFVMVMTIHERVPFLGLALIAWLLPVIGNPVALVLTFLMLIWQGLGAGFTANAWQNLIGKIFPSEYRGTFFGLQSSAANLLASIGSVTAGIILTHFNPRLGYTICFLCACMMLVISWFALNMTVEEDKGSGENLTVQNELWKNVGAILKKDIPFRWFLVTRILTQFGTMAFAFYTVYAVRRHGISESVAGIMASVLMMTQVACNPLLGWLGDRWSRKWILEIGAVCAMLSALLAWLAPNMTTFFIVVILAGIAYTAFWTIGMALTLDFGTDEEKPTYIGMANTLIAPAGIIAPLLGGLLADASGYPVTFIVSAAFALVTTLVLHFFVKSTKSTKTEPVIVSEINKY
jgi:MFS family permease